MVFNSILRSSIIALHLESYQSEPKILRLVYQSEPKILRLVFLVVVSERRSEEARVSVI